MKAYSTCNIHQIYFSHGQLPLLDKHFIPFDNSASTCPKLREYDIFKRFYDNNLHTQAELVGAISWKFQEKTGLRGKKFLQFIERNPGYDVYFINPFPHENQYSSPWTQGELCHPGIIDLTQFVLNELNYNIDLSHIKNDCLTTAYCNYWVGNKFFWDSYMDFTLPIYDYILNKSPQGIRKKFLHERADKVIDVPYFPFVFERLFSLLLVANLKIKHKSYFYNLWQLKKKYGLKESVSLYKQSLSCRFKNKR